MEQCLEKMEPALPVKAPEPVAVLGVAAVEPGKVRVMVAEWAVEAARVKGEGEVVVVVVVVLVAAVVVANVEEGVDREVLAERFAMRCRL